MKTVAVLTFPMKSKGGKTYTCNMVAVSLYGTAKRKHGIKYKNRKQQVDNQLNLFG